MQLVEGAESAPNAPAINPQREDMHSTLLKNGYRMDSLDNHDKLHDESTKNVIGYNHETLPPAQIHTWPAKNYGDNGSSEGRYNRGADAAVVINTKGGTKMAGDAQGINTHISDIKAGY